MNLWLLASIVLNAILLTVLALVLASQKKSIGRQKTATFSKMLDVFAYGSFYSQFDMRMERLALRMTNVIPSINKDELCWRLSRLSVLGHLTNADPSFVDVAGDDARLEILDKIEGESEAEAVWKCIDSALTRGLGFDEPLRNFEQKTLKLAQLQTEKPLVDAYRQSLAARVS